MVTGGLAVKGLRLFKFEYDVSGSQVNLVVLTKANPEEVEQAKQATLERIVKERGGDRTDIMLNGISDLGLLHLISPSVVDLLGQYFQQASALGHEQAAPEVPPLVKGGKRKYTRRK